MKKRIRLTEGNLRRLVEDALDELDWKTYMNAARKEMSDERDGMGDYNKRSNRADRFLRSAADSFKDKHGMEYSPKSNPYYTGLSKGKKLPDGGYEETLVSMYPWWKEEPYRFSMATNYNIYDADDDKNRNLVYGDYGNKARDFCYADPDLAELTPECGYGKGNPAFSDAYDYMRGKSKYTKGKGWENESRRRMVNAITESVVRRLKRR